MLRFRRPGSPTLYRNLTALLTALLVAAAASALELTGIASSPLAALDDAAHDLLLRSQPAGTILGSLGINEAADPRTFITIVAIDERTIAELGAYNGGYPRSYHAQVVENLLAAPPRVIAFDFGFFEPTADDTALATAFAHARSLPVPTSIILGTVGLASRGQPAARTPSGELVFDGGLVPVPVLAENASLALANIVPDERGTIRSMPLVAYVQGAVLADPALAVDVLQQLQQVGVVAALDDFGSGYSSLGYLKQFPVHELKIDRSLVSDIVREPRDRTIVRSTVELGHSLGLVVVAEGVEDEATLTLLSALGCDLAQGFLIARPMPAPSLLEWLRDWELAQHRSAAA